MRILKRGPKRNRGGVAEWKECRAYRGGLCLPLGKHFLIFSFLIGSYREQLLLLRFIAGNLLLLRLHFISRIHRLILLRRQSGFLALGLRFRRANISKEISQIGFERGKRIKVAEEVGDILCTKHDTDDRVLVHHLGLTENGGERFLPPFNAARELSDNRILLRYLRSELLNDDVFCVNLCLRRLNLSIEEGDIALQRIFLRLRITDNLLLFRNLLLEHIILCLKCRALFGREVLCVYALS